jgi:hypothetical protein
MRNATAQSLEFSDDAQRSSDSVTCIRATSTHQQSA